ncbi:MAG: aspartyl/glutamyl-tRNA amidotransferase subunit B [Alphaproteobacteria bacterium RIFCSPLOWO2_01_FULL_45_8]|nr:MAG: aspartyl/glutamyl-tRNA amidotransferase subunit B [Alphaproteobacteria bacterium GWB1_45_5]OFW75934.1 MAG: aspartyl/glutamyl-tRNA amidotransferase subunit B [Alphaproteobacteria bacterium GWA1_45_9]OFW90026.1 MAG: aspartyl/glutamyl-tRNA amidotransferase subunit B [Alphaproteobacteria bacterium RIFCSPHIGHO2_01_FULL_41_14]OFW96273.1 MAG: aspartyl/glutamyl-tRNA amidotransferase subunit B [Alphaproteobacteria bacterium RIFCSPLOWO2_01_FULL_45_8]HCI49198.1 Asp-tRNA(Asn)/Glu-tRNA(Gln) amidotra
MSKNYWLHTDSGPWNVVIGLEVHAQVTSASKLFSSAPTSFAADPNSKVSLVDAALPGMLPVLNKKCIEQAVKTGFGINAKINKFSMFDRKNYFYADLPQGYQISQLYHPIIGEGFLDLDLQDGTSHHVRIERIHLEQDAGKSIHDLHPKKTCIDLNRSGTALMEIVTFPDMNTPEQAMAFIKKLRLILRYLGTSDGNMDEGSLRADVNVSVNRPGESWGCRAEVKNVNSIRYIGHAIEHEARRQVEILENGGTLTQETRLYDPNRGETRSMRSKETAMDYRYFPDPDLLPLILTDEYLEGIKRNLPELPDQKKERFMKKYGLTPYDADLLIEDKDVANFYEKAVSETDGWKSNKNPATAKLISNWLSGDFFALMNKENKSIHDVPVSAEHLAELVNLIQKDVISGRIAKEVFTDAWTSSKSPKAIVSEKGLEQITDTGALEQIIQTVLENNPDMVTQYKSGKDKLFVFFVGQVMKETKGKANPAAVNDLLNKKLSTN